MLAYGAASAGDAAGTERCGLTMVTPRVLGRFGWGIADQALSSSTNFALTLVVARAVGLRSLGVFALTFAAYTLVLGAARALITEPLLMRYSTGSETEWRAASSVATYLATCVGVVAGTGLLLLSLATGKALSEAFVALALVLPGLMWQDSWRYAFFTRRMGSKAFVNDLVWAVLLVPALAAVLATGRGSVPWFILAWGVPGTVAAGVGVLQAGFLPKPGSPQVWWRRHRAISGRLLGEFLTWTSAAHIGMYGIAAVAGIAAVGTLRAADVLLGPLNVLQTGTGLVAVPEGVRLLQRSPTRLRNMVLLMAGVIGGSALVLGLCLRLLPDHLGVTLLKVNWPAAQSVLVPWTVVRLGSGVVAAAGFGLRSLVATRRSLRARLVGDALFVIGGIAGASLRGAHGAAVGMALAGSAGAVIWMLQFERALADHRATRESGADPPDGIGGRSFPG